MHKQIAGYRSYDAALESGRNWRAATTRTAAPPPARTKGSQTYKVQADRDCCDGICKRLRNRPQMPLQPALVQRGKPLRTQRCRPGGRFRPAAQIALQAIPEPPDPQ